jgi:YebC/PmpR family DNA-binding regulatory protein
MSGHSKWSTIKRKKGAIDAKKGKIFTKLVREIMTAARLGGGDPNGNPRLRAAISAAKAASMPADNIERGIKKATGTGDGPPPEEITYEGYGPGGVAIIIEAQTDNRNRTSAEIRATFTKTGGNMGATNSVGYMFKKRGVFAFDAGKYAEDEIMEAALEAGADDVSTEGDVITVVCEMRAFGAIADRFEKSGMQPASAELTMLPDNTVKVAGGDAEQLFKLIERLEDLDDVQKVHANFDVDTAEMERIASASPG